MALGFAFPPYAKGGVVRLKSGKTAKQALARRPCIRALFL
jgi:hypothetical protein